MPSIHYLNPPPNPFWDFVADMQEHPFFSAYRQPAHPPHPPHPAQPEQPREAASTASTAQHGSNQQANVEDPPEVDPSTLKGGEEKRPETRGMPFSGRGRFAHAFDEEGESPRECRGRRGWGHRGRGWGAPFGGPPPPFFGPGRSGPFAAPEPHGPPGHAHTHGPPPPGEGPPGRGRHWHRGGPAHRHGPPRQGAPGFDLGKFLSDLGSRNWADWQGPREGFFPNTNRSAPHHHGSDADFEPKTDIFDRDADFILHLSLPGAKKDDIGVDWDGEHSVLRVAGVVHRPGVDEKMLSQLSVDGRKREVGVFEKFIRLGTKHQPATIDVAGIKAKMADGVLIITVPKTEKQHERRDVPIGHSQTPSPAKNEKDLLFDADQEMQEAEIEMVKKAPAEKTEVAKGKQAEYEAEKEHHASQATAQEERLPEYAAEEDHEDHEDVSEWEQFASDEEGEFVKINVD